MRHIKDKKGKKMPTIQGIEYVTAPDIARMFQVTRQTVYRWIERGLIPDYIDMGIKARTRYLIPLMSLQDFTPPGSIPGTPGWSARDRNVSQDVS